MNRRRLAPKRQPITVQGGMARIEPIPDIVADMWDAFRIDSARL